jgi:Flp pilus assembly protein CpaB
MVAATGVLLAHRSATEPPRQRFVVTTVAIPAGHRLASDDLGTMAIDLPEDVAAVSTQRAADLIGRTTRVPLEPLSLIRPGDVFEAGRFPTPRDVEVAVELRPARALSGAASTGDIVDVLATDPDSTGTRLVAAGARISGVVDGRDGGIGSAGMIQVRLALGDGRAAAAVVDASVRSELTLVLPAPGADR